ncbi:MAG: DUF433 domain-containing protein [Xanthomonadales bacterium]|nr:DUF433 domain-containing protein [Xanthomonadales bacterium]
MLDYRQHITLQADKRSGKPCVRGLRITVQDVLGWLTSGMTTEDIVRDYPELSRDDILACLAWAAAREQSVAWVKAAA